MRKVQSMDIVFDPASEERLVLYMGHSIEAALERVRQTREYLCNITGPHKDETAAENMQYEAVYRQGYADCLMQFVALKIIKK